MAHRSFTITLPADTAYYNLYDRLKLITGAVPIDGILPDRVSVLTLTSDPTGGVGFNISDRNNANAAGGLISGGQGFEKASNRNSICIRDYYVSGLSAVIAVDIESI